MNTLEGKQVLLVSVKFMGYETVIRQYLMSLGADVVYWDERPSNSTLMKGLLRLWPKLLKNLISKYYRKKFERTSSLKFDYILIIKGEVIPPDILRRLLQANPNTKIIIYLWDSLANSKHAHCLLPYANQVFSFDKADCDRFGFKFQPLFGDVEGFAEIEEAQIIKYDLFFVGTVHSDRYKLVKEIEQKLVQKNLSSFIYFYTQSKFVLAYKWIFEKGFGRIKISEVKYSTLTREAYKKHMIESRVILDIHHPNQSGLTQRPLDALVLGKKIITTNSSIVHYDFFHKSNIQIIDRKNPQIDFEFFETPYYPIDENIVANYSIDSWIKEVFSIN